MSGASTPGTSTADSGQRWAALDSRNERLVDASHPLLRLVDDSRDDAKREPEAAA
jgi:hypothetical protein